VEIPADKFEVALSGDVAFDGSALEGFHRTIESELLLKPDLETLRISAPVAGETRTARLICDVHNLDHTPFEGCPRTRLKKVLQLFTEKGYSVLVAPEIEFFLFLRDAHAAGGGQGMGGRQRGDQRQPGAQPRHGRKRAVALRRGRAEPA